MILMTQDGKHAINMKHVESVCVVHKDKFEDPTAPAEVTAKLIETGWTLLGEYENDKKADEVFQWLVGKWSDKYTSFERMP